MTRIYGPGASIAGPAPGTVVQRDSAGRVTLQAVGINEETTWLVQGFDHLGRGPQAALSAAGRLLAVEGFIAGPIIGATSANWAGAAIEPTARGIAGALAHWAGYVAMPPNANPGTFAQVLRIDNAGVSTLEFWANINAGKTAPNTAGMAIGLDVAGVAGLTTDLIVSSFNGPSAGAWAEALRVTQAGVLALLFGPNFNYAAIAAGTGGAPTLPANTPTGGAGGAGKWIQVQLQGVTGWLLLWQ